MTTVAGRRIIDRLAVPRARAATIESVPPARPVAGWAVLATALMPTVLTAAWLIAGALQPPMYSPIRQTVSVLSGHAASHRWIMTAALYLLGVGYLITAGLLTALSAPSRVGLVITGATAIGVASFPQPHHGTSQAHAVCTGVGAIALAIWPALVAREPAVRGALGAPVLAASIVVSFSLFAWTAVETRDGTALGLAERASSVAQVCWPLVVAVALRRAWPRELSGSRPEAASRARRRPWSGPAVAGREPSPRQASDPRPGH